MWIPFSTPAKLALRSQPCHLSRGRAPARPRGSRCFPTDASTRQRASGTTGISLFWSRRAGKRNFPRGTPGLERAGWSKHGYLGRMVSKVLRWEIPRRRPVSADASFRVHSFSRSYGNFRWWVCIRLASPGAWKPEELRRKFCFLGRFFYSVCSTLPRPLPGQPLRVPLHPHTPQNRQDQDLRGPSETWKRPKVDRRRSRGSDHSPPASPVVPRR